MAYLLYCTVRKRRTTMPWPLTVQELTGKWSSLGTVLLPYQTMWWILRRRETPDHPGYTRPLCHKVGEGALSYMG